MGLLRRGLELREAGAAPPPSAAGVKLSFAI